MTKSLAASAVEYIKQHFNEEFGERYCGLLVNAENTYPEVQYAKVYPNPAHDQFFIESSVDKLEVELYNTMGQRVLSETWTGQAISLEHIPTGYYVVQLRDKVRIAGVERLIVVEN